MIVGGRKHLFALVPLVALALAGCGGGGDDEANEPAPVEAAAETAALSKQELLAQGEAICAEVNAAVGAIGSTSTGATGQSGQVADLYAGLAERLEGLGAPSDEAAGYPQLVAAAKQLAEAESDAALATERGEDSAAAAAQADTALASFQAAADSFGFDACGEEPSAPQRGDATAAGSESDAGGVEPAAPEETVEEVETAPETGGGAAPETGGGAPAGGGTGPGAGAGDSGGIGPG